MGAGGGELSPRGLALSHQDGESRREEQRKAGKDAVSGPLSRARCPRRPGVSWSGCPEGQQGREAQGSTVPPGPVPLTASLGASLGLCSDAGGARPLRNERAFLGAVGLPDCSQIQRAPEKQASGTPSGHSWVTSLATYKQKQRRGV